MPVLLTVLTVGAAVALLALLMIGLLLIYKPLESIREHLERITMGVRAIEWQTRDATGVSRRAELVLSEIGAACASLAPVLERQNARVLGRRACEVLGGRDA